MFMAKKKSVNKKRKITRKVKKTCRCASGKDKNSKVKKLIKLAKSGKDSERVQVSSIKARRKKTKNKKR